MRRILIGAAVVGATVAAAPVSGLTTPAQWQFCSGTSLNVCMDFTLTHAGGNTYLLTFKFDSAPAGQGGVMTAAGLYRVGGANLPNLDVQGATIVDVSPGNLADWSIGQGGLAGGGQLVIQAAANSNQGATNGITPGGWVTISFSSSNLSSYTTTLYARGHVQAFGPNSCSLKPDSRTGVVGDLADVNEECGDLPTTPGEVVPEPITMILLGSGLLGVGGAAHRRRRREGKSLV